MAQMANSHDPPASWASGVFHAFVGPAVVAGPVKSMRQVPSRRVKVWGDALDGGDAAPSRGRSSLGLINGRTMSVKKSHHVDGDHRFTASSSARAGKSPARRNLVAAEWGRRERGGPYFPRPAADGGLPSSGRGVSHGAPLSRGRSRYDSRGGPPATGLKSRGGDRARRHPRRVETTRRRGRGLAAAAARGPDAS